MVVVVVVVVMGCGVGCTKFGASNRGDVYSEDVDAVDSSCCELALDDLQSHHQNHRMNLHNGYQPD